MLSDDLVAEMEEAIQAANNARTALEEALDAVDTYDGDPTSASDILKPVAAALEKWRDAQQRFMGAVEEADVPDVSTAALLLRTNHGLDATNVRRGLPGVHVEGTDQPFDVNLEGHRGTVLTQAAMHHVDSDE